jgi:hypothetical protein
MRLKQCRLIRRAALTATAAMAVVLVWGTGVSLARGINAVHYYEDTEGNLCVGNEEVGGFTKSCSLWGAATQKGKDDVGVGEKVLENNTTGNEDVGVGFDALAESTTGSGNTATGFFACLHITSGTSNTCTGADAALRNTTGKENTSDGVGALFDNKTGNANVAISTDALEKITEGSNNVAIGPKAGGEMEGNAANDIDISNKGVLGDNRTTRVGTENTEARAFVAGIYEKTVKTPSCAVVVSSEGQLGCKTGPGGAVSSGGSPALVAQLQSEHAQVDRQQEEIDKLASELQSLRQEVHPDR